MKQKSLSIYDLDQLFNSNRVRLFISAKTKNPSFDLIYDIAQVLEVRLDELLKDPNTNAKQEDYSIKFKKSDLNILKEKIEDLSSELKRTKINFLTNNLVQNIKVLMKKQSLCVADIEKFIGLNNLRDILVGNRKTTSILLLYQIAELLNVTTEQLLKPRYNLNKDQNNSFSNTPKLDLSILEQKITNILSDVQNFSPDIIHSKDSELSLHNLEQKIKDILSYIQKI